MSNPARLDIFRKRATRLRSRQVRHGLTRRDIVPALAPVLDQLPSPKRKSNKLRSTPALLPPGSRLPLSPLTPAPNKRLESMRSPSPMKRSPPRKSPLKSIVIQPSPRKETPRMGFQYIFEAKAPVEKSTSRYEVYSKIFGPPPQISKSLDQTITLQIPDSTLTLAGKLKSPLAQPKKPDPSSSLVNRKEQSSPAKSVLRNDTFAVPSLPVPAGPPQLPPSSLQRPRKNSAAAVLEPPPTMKKSALPRPTTGRISSALPVPMVRRSARTLQKPNLTTAGQTTTVAPTAAPPKGVLIREAGKTGFANAAVERKAFEAAIVPALPSLPGVASVPPAANMAEKRSITVETNLFAVESVTVDRRKNKLGGAQRVTRGVEMVSRMKPWILKLD